jgi:hypothetical protein
VWHLRPVAVSRNPPGMKFIILNRAAAFLLI